ncbi:MAG: S-layer homology domain-containing protein [Candidatus Gracilibacteria bacterium]
MDKMPSSPQDDQKQKMIKNASIVGGFIAVTLAGSILFSGMSGSVFQASLLGSTTPKPFDGTVLPIQKTANWVKLTSSQYTNFKNGSFTYEQAGAVNQLIDIPKYDSAALANDPAKLSWKGSDLDIRNTLLTYVTAYMGAYTSGSAPAIENAGSHLAVDIRAPKGTPIFSIANGKVTKVKNDKTDGGVIVIEYSNVPSVEDPKVTTTYYASYLHMDTVAVSEGQVVDKGAQIGTVGNTGIATTYHLHLQLDRKEAPFHPYWPYTLTEAKAAGLDFVTGVDNGLGKDKGIQYTVNPYKWIYSNLNGTSSTSTGTTSTSSGVRNASTNTAPASTAGAAPTLSKLQVSSTDTSITAGNIATITVTALDTTEKPIDTFTTPVSISASQGAKGVLSTLSAFQKGTATFTYKTSDTENVAFTVVSGSVSSSISLSVTDRIKNPVKFALDYSSAGTVNTPMDIQIKAVDENNQPTLAGLTDAIIVGMEGGTGNFSKTILGFADFKDGVAVVTFTPSSAGTYTITAKAGNLAGSGPVMTVPSDAVAPTGAFSDVTEATVHGKAILYLKQKGIIEGYSDGTFRPEADINRAEGTKVILASLGSSPLSPLEQTSFTDTAASDWFSGWVELGKSLGVLAGNPDGTFTPARQVNLAEALKIVLLANKVDLTNETVFEKPYNDVEIDSWFAVYFQYAKNKNLLEADAEGNIRAGHTLTRGEVAELMYRLVRIQETNSETYSNAIDA